MSDLKSPSLSLSARCRALADECRSRARSFRNDKPRIQMFQLAADYERQARVAEALETALRDRYGLDTPLAPKETEAVGEQSTEN